MKTPLTLRRRLFWNTLLVLLAGMGLASALAWRSVEALYLDTQRENLLAQARLTALALQGTALPVSPPQPYSQTSNTLPGIHTRLLGEQGAVVLSLPLLPGELLPPAAESSTSISSAELLARSEIASALRGQPATAIRAPAIRRVLYAAAPILGDDGSVTGLVYLAMPLPAAGLPLNVVLQLVGAALAAVLLALVAGSLLARRISAPLEAVAGAAEAVSAGDLDVQAPIASNIRELNSLGLAFNHMTLSLRQSEQAKNAFVADVTHELRTPLTVIKGTIETLQDGALDDLDGRGPLLESMQTESERLIRMVNDLLLLTRAGAGTLDIRLSPLDLVELARARCAHLAGLAARQQVQLLVTGLDSACVCADPDRLAQVVDNLLDNALRYSPPGSAITLEIGRDGDHIQCAVSDQGPGIPQKDLPFIFERFYRADSSRNRQTGGAGLGLAIVRALLLAQAGDIQAESPARQGATMRFRLPASAADCHSPG